MESTLTYTVPQWNAIFAMFVVAMFALLAGFVYMISSREELSPRYRPIGLVSAIVPLVATVAYAILALSWVTGFTLAGDEYVPSDSALQFSNGFRYVDWAVTVPLLTVEMLGVCVVAGAAARRIRYWWISLAFLMILTGWLGAEIFGYNDDDTQRLVWGAISTAFFIPLYVWIWRPIMASRPHLDDETWKTIRNAGFVLAATWGVYPLAYLVPVWFDGSAEWAVARQAAFTVADIVAKVGFAVLIHRALKLRTAEDIREGTAPSEEPVWMSNVLLAPAVPASAASPPPRS